MSCIAENHQVQVGECLSFMGMESTAHVSHHPLSRAIEDWILDPVCFHPQNPDREEVYEATSLFQCLAGSALDMIQEGDFLASDHQRQLRDFISKANFCDNGGGLSAFHYRRYGGLVFFFRFSGGGLGFCTGPLDSWGYNADSAADMVRVAAYTSNPSHPFTTKSFVLLERRFEDDPFDVRPAYRLRLLTAGHRRLKVDPRTKTPENSVLGSITNFCCSLSQTGRVLHRQHSYC